MSGVTSLLQTISPLVWTIYIVKLHPAHTLLLRDSFTTALICDFASKPFSSP